MGEQIKKLSKGNWIAFMRKGRIVIGQIEYFERDVLGYWNYFTDEGSVREDSVLEVRES